ncbi:polysaccharide deacetylase family protein [Enterococcus wangshanyuanii]|uniref:Polysaccharide deacetylase n=1 Tax=Enterococcus wangshanyuanii TaxID=2005703 RepID=A0ABQ1PCR1_9ENTE|nr:polysaccharide deacetylase family protein [Enterococcus wangshanyuanii]GGC94629.1 polysaccharide deacetylase [Enterococcus wangshanyuanii]
MNKNSYSHSTRNGRRARRKQHIPKKLALLSLFASTLLLVGGGVYIAHALQSRSTAKETVDDQDNDYNKKEALLLEKIRQDQKEAALASTEQTEVTDKVQTLLYDPVQKGAIPRFSALKNELATMIDTVKRKHSNQQPIKIVGQVKMSNVTDQLKNYQPLLTIYSWDEKNRSWSEKTEPGATSDFVNQKNNQELTLTDLFTSEANLLAVQQVIKQKLLDDSPDGNTVIDSILSMPNMSLKNTSFTYHPDKISFNLPENATGSKEVSLAYREIAEYVNPEFVDQASIKDALVMPLDPNKKYISLTFDDGPNPKTTPKLLDILKEKGVKATFFMLGQNVVKNEAIVKRADEEGHEVASHSYSHPQLTAVDAERIKTEVQNTDKVIYHAIGKLPTDFRPPYGAVDPDAAAIISKPIIQWSVDSQDWQSHSIDKIIQRIHDTEYNDAIILMHDIYPETVDAVPIVIDRLRAEGYEIIPTKQLLGNKAKPMHMYYGSTDERPIQ